MMPLNLTYLHCLQHALFEHLFNLYSDKQGGLLVNANKFYCNVYLSRKQRKLCFGLFRFAVRKSEINCNLIEFII